MSRLVASFPQLERSTHSAVVDVLLVVPPFSEVVSPALGPSILATACRKQDLSSKVFYASLLFAAQISYERYQKISYSSYGEELLGEAIFRRAAFEEEEITSPKVLEQIFDQHEYISTYGIDGKKVVKEDMLYCLTQIESFLDQCVQQILAWNPKIVGFSSVFQQTMASIAIAKRLKKENPKIITVLGGANAASPMGKGIAQTTSVFDFIFSGEADFVFPEFCKNYLESGHLPSHFLVECSSIQTMDQTETPEYDDYYEQIKPFQKKGQLPSFLPRWLYIETSRGCWWGAKSHCTFCGLNALEMTYRRKSAERILQDIDYFTNKYHIKYLRAVDNIMPYEFHRDVLPALAQKNKGLKLFYEVKSNLKERDLDLFVSAGIVEVQPGIESLSSNVLKHIGKGVSGIQNLALLKNGASRNIYISWNMLAGVPGETLEDYEAMYQLFPGIEHLQAPDGWGFIRIDRFSPYHSYPEKYGITNIRPVPGYRRLYPEAAPFSEIAYYFHGDYTTEFLENAELQRKFSDALTLWKKRWESKKNRPKLNLYSLGAETFILEDTRHCAKSRYFFASPEQVVLLKETMQPLSCQKIEESLSSALKELLERRIIVCYEGYYLNVAVPSKLPISTIIFALSFLLGLVLVAFFLYRFWSGS